MIHISCFAFRKPSEDPSMRRTATTAAAILVVAVALSLDGIFESIACAAMQQPATIAVAVSKAVAVAPPLTPNVQFAEVVGGVSGRLGSQFMRLLQESGNGIDEMMDASVAVVAVPRGVCPGSMSTTTVAKNAATAAATPIFVCTIASKWNDIYESTVPERRCDLVFVGNGLLDIPMMTETVATIVIPHYAILRVGDAPVVAKNNASSPLPSQPPPPPPTFIAGKHAKLVQRLLHRDGIVTSILDMNDQVTVRSKAVLKLLWTSCLWLLCHAPAATSTTTSSSSSSSLGPLTVSQVHEQRSELLQELVSELWPSVCQTIRGDPSFGAAATTTDAHLQLPCLDDAMRYLRQYSYSIPHAIPSLPLALMELSDRNGIFANPHQPLHQQLVYQVAGAAGMSIFDNKSFIPVVQSPWNSIMRTVDLRSTIGLSVYGRNRDLASTSNNSSSRRHILIVGAGILGCSVALNLARMQQNTGTPDMDIIVIDSSAGMTDTGPTTKASWAWLNANQKQPAHYQQLNALGMHAWRSDALLRDLPLWNGSLVRYNAPLESIATTVAGFYTRAVGPLTQQEVQELEPHAQFEEDIGSPVYSFPNEGLVDPCEAVVTMRQAAKELGVTFLWSHSVTSIVYDKGTVSGVNVVAIDPNVPTPSLPFKLDTDLVIVTAGAGSAALCGVPLIDRPGRIAFYNPPPNVGSTNPVPVLQLKRILVDMVGKSHLLQRRDGTIVAGGGPLEVGGTMNDNSAAMSAATSAEQTASEINVQRLGAGAFNLAPLLLKDAIFRETAAATRPMPRDGLPVVGFTKPGLYTVVSHSGITLAPLIGALAAVEIAHTLDLDLLAPYRPQRFHNET